MNIAVGGIIATKFFRFYTDRIGHLCSNTELFIREDYNPKDKYIGFNDDYICNRQLLDMFSRYMCKKMIYNSHVRDICETVFSNRFIKHYHFNPTAYSSFKGEPFLEFNKDECRLGMEELARMGVDSWYVCFHNRDGSYLNNRKEYHKDFSYHDYRDSDVKNQIKAMEYVTEQGGYAIRMGYLVDEPLETDNPRIIDYASRFRSDFMDIFLSANCKFFVGNSAGLICVAFLFNTPSVMLNSCPLEYVDMPKGGLFLPKLVYNTDEDRLLSFEEVLTKGIGSFTRMEQFDRYHLSNVENTSEDILGVVREMNMRVDMEWDNIYEKLQSRFWSLFKPYHRCYGCPARVGSRFLKNHEGLL